MFEHSVAGQQLELVSYTPELQEVPFRNPQLDPLSPQQSAVFVSQPSHGCSSVGADGSWLGSSSPILSPTTHSTLAGFPALSLKPVQPLLNKIDEDPEALSPKHKGGGLQIDLGCLLPPEKRGLSLTHAEDGIANGMAASVGGTNHDRVSMLKQELGDGEGVTALLSKCAGNGVVSVAEDDGIFSDDENMPLSPTTRLRHDTYGATLDFLEALCDASNCLTSVSQVCHMCMGDLASSHPAG